MKNGAEVRVARTIDEIKEFAHMLHHVYSWKIRRHFPSREFFRQLALQATDPQRQSRIFIVTYKIRLSVVVPVSTRATMLTFGFRAACAKPTPCNTLAYWLYGKP